MLHGGRSFEPFEQPWRRCFPLPLQMLFLLSASPSLPLMTPLCWGHWVERSASYSFIFPFTELVRCLSLPASRAGCRASVHAKISPLSPSPPVFMFPPIYALPARKFFHISLISVPCHEIYADWESQNASMPCFFELPLRRYAWISACLLGMAAFFRMPCLYLPSEYTSWSSPPTLYRGLLIEPNIFCADASASFLPRLIYSTKVRMFLKSSSSLSRHDPLISYGAFQALILFHAPCLYLLARLCRLFI